MKRILPLIVTAAIPALALALIAALSFPAARASAAAETKPKIVSVDYVLALMDAGIDQREIVRRIEEKNLAFRIAPGDIDRLREAGAGKKLLDVVIGEQDANQWERPSRLGANEGETNGEGIEEMPDSGYYAPGYSSFTFSYGYPYPYYYYPYYYPYYYYGLYGYHTHYSTPYFRYPGYSYRTVPRGSGWIRSAPRGGSFRATPRTGGSARPSPRGSHHH